MRRRLAIGTAVLAAATMLAAGALWQGSGDEDRERTPSGQAGSGIGGGGTASLTGSAPGDSPAARAPGRCVLEGLVLRAREPSAAAVEVRWSAVTEYLEVDEHGVSALGARSPDAAVVWRGRAGDDGRFVCEGLPAGRWDVSAVAADGARSEGSASAGVDGVRNVLVLSLLAASETLRGQVLGSDGNAAACRLQVAGRAVDVSADGSFEVHDLWVGPCKLTAQGADCARAGLTVSLPHRDPVVLRMRRPAGERVVRTFSSRGGSALEGVEVHVSGCRGAVAVTDHEGRARVPLDGPGWLKFVEPGYRTVAVRVAEGAPTEEVEVFLREAAEIRGHVRDAATGRGLEGVLVEASEGDFRVSTPAASVVSAADGAYVLEDLAAGPLTVVARGRTSIVRGLASMPADDDFGSIRRDRLEFDPLLVDVPSGTTTLDLEMVPGAVLRGRVLDAVGSPVGGAAVVVYAPRAPYMSSTPDPVYWERYATATDAEGRYEFAALLPGRRYDARASAPGSRARGQVRVPADGGRAVLDFRLPASFSFDVRVVDEESGVGLPRIHVGATGEYGNEAAREVVTGEDGWTRLGPVPGHAVRVRARRHRDGVTVEQAIDLSRGAPTAPLVLRLPPAPPEGEAGAAVARAGWLGEWEEFARYGASGELEHLSGGGQTRGGAPFTVTVLDADGAAVPSADLLWWDAGDWRGTEARVVDGSVRLAVPESVASRLWVEVRGPRDRAGNTLPLGPARVGPCDVKAGRAEVRLPAERTISGRVVGPDGRGVRGIRLYAVEADWAALEARTFSREYPEAHTDGTGAFRLRGLAAGAHYIAFHVPPEFAPVPPSVQESGDSGVEFRLRPGEVASLRLVDPAGRPVVGASVFVSGVPYRSQPLPQDLWSGPRQGGESGEDGVVRIAGLSREVPCRIHATPPADREDLRTLELDAWVPTSGDLVFPGLATVSGVVRGTDGAPIPGAHVEALDKNTWESIGKAGPDGSFVVRVPTAGKTRLAGVAYEVDRGDPDGIYWGERVGYRSAPVEVEAGATGVALVIDRGVDLTVRVLHPGARAGWGPGVSYDGLLYDEAPAEPGKPDAGFAGRSGRHGDLYRFRQLQVGKTYTFWLAPDLAGVYVLATGLRAEKGRTEVTVTVTAAKGLPIRGRILGLAEVGSTTVRAKQGAIHVYLDSAPDGTFEFPGLPEGEWLLRVDLRRDDGVWTGQAVARAGDEVDLRLEPKPAKQGR